ncbi:MAG: hypothetical protein DRH37_02485 [Deltaproteobacteria bacterium]|nr:MAG: hypothetical protein B5M55_04170 [Desulfococcus sp. 4484_242]RLC31696.1 MAG: hypothetical protein DRH37_02485 [Deltaproteobacteria bacterium]
MRTGRSAQGGCAHHDIWDIVALSACLCAACLPSGRDRQAYRQVGLIVRDLPLDLAQNRSFFKGLVTPLELTKAFRKSLTKIPHAPVTGLWEHF